MFYPAENKASIKEGDVVAARCTMDNYQDHLVTIGNTGNDEMCNFYLMYYVDGDEILSKNFCFSSGPPYYYWTSDPLLKYHVPKNVDKEASQL
jgi:peptidyl-glycine alpha-amidating monooxygenase 1, putative